MCDFGQAAKSFELKSTNNKIIKLNDVKGENGTLVMFICNHCPYVIAVIEDIIEDSKDLEKLGIKTVAICFIAINKSLSPVLTGFKLSSSLILPLYCNSKLLLYPKKSGVHTAS